jgi:hypothetical protein
LNLTLKKGEPLQAAPLFDLKAGYDTLAHPFVLVNPTVVMVVTPVMVVPIVVGHGQSFVHGMVVAMVVVMMRHGVRPRFIREERCGTQCVHGQDRYGDELSHGSTS